MLVQIAEIKETIDAAKQMVRGNVGVEIETVEQWSLRNFLASHHLDALDLRRKYSTADRTSRSAKRASFSTELAESGCSNPAQGPCDDVGGSGLRAGTVRDHQPLRLPFQHFSQGGAGRAVPQETGAPIARRAPVFPGQAAESHDHALPAGEVFVGEPLDQVADDRGTRGTVEKSHLCHRNGSAENGLIDVRVPRWIR